MSELCNGDSTQYEFQVVFEIGGGYSCDSDGFLTQWRTAAPDVMDMMDLMDMMDVMDIWGGSETLGNTGV